ENVKLFFRDFMDECSHTKSLEKGHGRIEKREFFLSSEIEWLPQKSSWTNLNAIGAVKSDIIPLE
ncbi:MAG: hypothetical protein RR573_11495, partial [Oscillospiraceae bacterium]